LDRNRRGIVRRFDVVVLGAGPAGSSCALRLTQFGHAVALVGEAGPRDTIRQHVGESLPSSTRVLFSALGLELPRDAVVHRPPEHHVFWGSMRGAASSPRVPERESSLLVWRGVLDRFLKESATAAGVRLFASKARSVRRTGDGATVLTSGGDRLTSPLVVDATGRSGILARSFRRKETRFRTLALTTHFRTTEVSPPTLVEAFADGWIWSQPTRDGLRDVTAMIDLPDAVAKLDRRALHRKALEAARNAARLVGASPAAGPVRGIDATPYDAERFAARDFFLVGDAASFLDPLSSHGVHKAMDDGLAAAVAIRTLLSRPHRADDAIDYYEARERDIYRVTTERLRALYAQETSFASRPFWKKRSEPDRPGSPAPRAGLTVLEGDVELQPARDVRLRDAPVLENDFIERREVLEAPGGERPVRFFGPVCLPDLYRDVLATGRRVQAARRSEFGLDRALAAIDWLYRSGYLERRETTGR
jgi:flavin-dependent dehydrogenase